MVIDVPHGYEVGTMVEVPMTGLPRYGVIKWIGYLPQMKDKLVVGLELVRWGVSKWMTADMIILIMHFDCRNSRLSFCFKGQSSLIRSCVHPVKLFK